MQNQTETQRETQVLREWLYFIRASQQALGKFHDQLSQMAENGNRELEPGDFFTGLRKLNDVIGDGWADGALQNIDHLADVVMGEGLPPITVCANDETRDAASLDVIFGGESVVTLECRFMPHGERHAWENIAPIFIKVRKDHMRDDLNDYHLRELAAQGDPHAEIRVNTPGSPGALAYWEL